MSRALSSFSWLKIVVIFLFVGVLYLTIFASQQKTWAETCGTGPDGTYKGWCATNSQRIAGGSGTDPYREEAYNQCIQCCASTGHFLCSTPSQPTCNSVGGSCVHRLSCYPDYMSRSAGDDDCSRFGNFSCCGPRTCSSLGGNCVPSSSTCSANGGYVSSGGNSYCSQVSYGYAGTCCVIPGVPAAPPPPPGPPPPPRYDINGYVWIDKNRDGSKQSDEPYFTGHLTVQLSGAASSTTDTYTGTPGPYAFFGYLAGNYTVSISVPAGYDATTGTSQSFFLNANRYNVNFGIVPYYSISGNVFNDLNKDRVKDFIDPDTNPVMESNITSGINITTTGGNLTVNNSAGTYNIAHLYEGQYTVSYTTSPLPAGYFLIYPLNGPPPQFRLYVGTNCYQNVNLSFGASCFGNDNGSIQNVNFAISNSVPWFQTYGLNMRLDEGFEDKIPSSPLYPRYASVADNANGTGYLITPTPTYTPTPTLTPTPTPTLTPTPTSVYGVGFGCNAGGYSGTCKDRNVTSCPTYYDAGNYCPGGNSVQCCVTNQVACRSTGRCHNRYANDGGNIYSCSQTWYSGYCPGPFDVQCCAP